MKEKYKNFFSINITVDGNKALHDSCRLTPSGEGSYDIAIKAALHNAKKWGSNGTKITLSPDNVQYTFDAISNMINLGFNFISINPAYEEGWTDKHGTILYYELKKLTEWIYNNNLEEKCWIRIFEERDFQPFSSDRNKNWCGSNSCMLAIDWKGEIYPCIRFMESSLNNEQPPLVIGNINDGLFTTEAQKNIQKELDSLTVVSQSTQECLDCSICSGCSWCTAYNY